MKGNTAENMERNRDANTCNESEISVGALWKRWCDEMNKIV